MEHNAGYNAKSLRKCGQSKHMSDLGLSMSRTIGSILQIKHFEQFNYGLPHASLEQV